MAAYSYKTKELLDSKVNFAAIYFDKQERIKEMTGFDFSLADIVRYIKSETENFQNYIELAVEIDKAIYGIYNNWVRETGQKEAEPTPAPAAEPSEDDTIEAIELMFELLPDDDTQEAIELMIELLDEKKQATMMRKLKKALNN
jgi:hypothetical protein